MHGDMKKYTGRQEQETLLWHRQKELSQDVFSLYKKTHVSCHKINKTATNSSKNQSRWKLWQCSQHTLWTGHFTNVGVHWQRCYNQTDRHKQNQYPFQPLMVEDKYSGTCHLHATIPSKWVASRPTESSSDMNEYVRKKKNNWQINRRNPVISKHLYFLNTFMWKTIILNNFFS